MKVKNIVICGLMVALGVLLPQVFHVFGSMGGMLFLPIHYGVFLAGMLLPPGYGGIAGILIPALSGLIIGMPPVPKVYFMMPELVTYGLVTGVLKEKMLPVKALIIAMVSGRIVYGLSLLVGNYILGMKAPFMQFSSFSYGIAVGIPGLLIQLIVIPIIVKKVHKGVGVAYAR